MNRKMTMCFVMVMAGIIAAGCEQSSDMMLNDNQQSSQNGDSRGFGEATSGIDEGAAFGKDGEMAELAEALETQEDIAGAKLDTQDRVKIEGSNPYLYFVDPNYNDWIIKDDSGRLKFNYYDSGWITALTIDRAGDIGINTTSPNYKLDVKGTIRAEEVIVETGWSDFVFEDDYKLRPLSEVENFIEENGHLPDVPSAAHIHSSGVSIGESQSVLLQKIEELTLYVIDQQKQIQSLKKQVTNHKNGK